MRLPKYALFLPIIFSILILSSSAFTAVIYVKQDSPGGIGSPPVFDGRSWESAYHTIQQALGVAVAGDEIWAARGIYFERIVMKSGVSMYGGFYGIETSRSHRNWLANPAILDGNQQGAVVSCPSPEDGTASYVIDGFTVQNGKTQVNVNGAGMVCGRASVTIANCLIRGNASGGNGGGIYCASSTVTIYNNRIVGNTATGTYTNAGGGIYCTATSGVVANNTIVGNTAPTAGGVYCSSGGILIANNLMAFCSSGIFSSQSPGSSNPVVRNNCAYGNWDYNYGWEESLLDQFGNISADPRLASYEFGNLHIQADSPCIDAGYDGAIPSEWLDVDRQERIQGAHVDIGADESAGVTWPEGPYTIVRVSHTGSDSNDGSSWASTKRTIQAAVNAASDEGGEVWVKSGTYVERIKLPAFAHVYGGFRATEVARDERPAFPRPDADPDATVLDGTQTGIVVTAYSGNKCSRIDGLTIRNGKTTGSGAGILCSGAAPVIANNIIKQNSAGSGGGIHCLTASPEIRNNVITGNTSSTCGGGINAYCYAAPVIAGNTITGNTALQGGGGVTCSATRATTISNNTLSGNNANGIYIRWSSPVTVQDNAIAGNTGTGILCDGSNAAIRGNAITGNTNTAVGTPYGGGIHCNGYTESLITGNTISGNTASFGNGICCTGSGCRPTIAGNLIVNNGGTAHISKGGGICSWSSAAPHIIGNTIVGNVTKSSGVFYGGGVYFESCPSSLAGNVIAFNTTGVYRAVTTDLPGNYRNNCVFSNGVNSPVRNYALIDPGLNDISVDPGFVDRAAGNYHLSSGSPCINQGWLDPQYAYLFDIDGEGRITGPAMDIGADECWSGDLAIVDLKKTADGAKVVGHNAMITAVFPGFFYVETVDRSSGMRVKGSHPGMAVGLAADIQGKLATTPDGERCIEASGVTPSPGTAINPVGLNMKALGGDDWLYSATYGSGQKGVTGGLGLNNIGLLVKVWGKVTHAGDGWFYLDDGSRLSDGSGYTGVKVLADGLSIPSEGRYARVTGISSCIKSGSSIHRLIRATEVAAL